MLFSFLGGTAILNLMLNLVVFFTALFYLLSSSTAKYKPVEMFNRWTSGGGASSHASNFALAVEEAVNSVFTASFKMAAFYGMWTWLIHTLFQVNFPLTIYNPTTYFYFIISHFRRISCAVAVLVRLQLHFICYR